jgi:hypothetical protein
MQNHERITLLRDDHRLAELEKTIARGKKTFVEVGLALAEIRDLRLYRREYAGFAEYCRERWGWSKPYCNQLITAAAVVESLPAEQKAAIATESQARVLAKVAPEQRAGVVQAVVDQGKPVTAARIKRNLPPPPMVRNGTNGTDGPQVPPPPPSEVLDATGWPIPTHLIPLWNRAGEVQEMLTVLSRIKGALRSAQDNKDMLFAEVCFSSALSQLDQAWTDIKTAKPFGVCPACQGQVSDKCTLCRGRGLISEHRWNMCVSREDKEFRFKAKQKAESGKLKP